MNDLIADKSKIAVPVPTPETAEFWTGTKISELRLQCCDECQHVYSRRDLFVLLAPVGRYQPS